MAKFNLVLDTRVMKKDDKYNLCVRYTHKQDVMYLKIVDMTSQTYQNIFEKKVLDKRTIEYRENCYAYVTKAEKLYSSMEFFDKQKFRELFYSKETKKEVKVDGETDLDVLFDIYIDNTTLKEVSKSHYRYTLRMLKKYKPGIILTDITPTFLNEFEQNKINIEGLSPGTIGSYTREIKAVINYHQKTTKIVPADYEYPFGRGKYIVSSFFPSKSVMSNEEIQKVVEFNDFQTKQQEYARDIWLTLYRLNGINYADLLQMKWTDIKGDHISFIRRKTSTTRKYNIKPIISPYTDKLKESLEKVGVKSSPFILGKMKEGFSEKTFNNCSHKNRQKINRNLDYISGKLNLTIPLKIETARDCYWLDPLLFGHFC